MDHSFNLFTGILHGYFTATVTNVRFSGTSNKVLKDMNTISQYLTITKHVQWVHNLILEGLQQKLQKSCSRCNKTLGTSNRAIYCKPPKYLLLFVNRFRYIDNNVTKDRCPIPMDTTVRLGPLKFSLQANIDHRGASLHSGHYTASLNCCNKHSIATITQLRSLDLYCICYIV